MKLQNLFDNGSNEIYQGSFSNPGLLQKNESNLIELVLSREIRFL